MSFSLLACWCRGLRLLSVSVGLLACWCRGLRLLSVSVGLLACWCRGLRWPRLRCFCQKRPATCHVWKKPLIFVLESLLSAPISVIISLGVSICMLLSFISCFQDFGMTFMRALYSNCKFLLDPICCFTSSKIMSRPLIQRSCIYNNPALHQVTKNRGDPLYRMCLLFHMDSVLMEAGCRFWFIVVVYFITSCQKNESILEIALLDFGSTDAFKARHGSAKMIFFSFNFNKCFSYQQMYYYFCITKRVILDVCCHLLPWKQNKMATKQHISNSSLY